MIVICFFCDLGAAIVDSGIYGTAQNYSLVENITCTGQENSVTDCTVNMASGCIPYCPFSNIGIRCFGECVSIFTNSLYYYLHYKTLESATKETSDLLTVLLRMRGVSRSVSTKYGALSATMDGIRLMPMWLVHSLDIRN